MRIVHKRHRDVQRAFPAAQCALCGGELYRGEYCWRLGRYVLCGDCAGRRTGGDSAFRRTRLGEAGR